MPFKFGLPSAVRGTRAAGAAPRPAGAAGAWPRRAAGRIASDTTTATPAAIIEVLNQFRIERSPVEAAINTFREMNFYLIAGSKSTRLNDKRGVPSGS